MHRLLAKLLIAFALCLLLAETASGHVVAANSGRAGAIAGRTDDVTTFYHGTSSEYASTIRANGVDLSKGNPGADFGRGFYLTTSREEALHSAGRLYDGPLDAVEFNVPNSELANLSRLEFGAADSAWQDFTRFHKTFAPEDLLHGGQPYDIVSGPLFRRFDRFGSPIPWENRLPQTSIHTPSAVDVFNAYMRKK